MGQAEQRAIARRVQQELSAELEALYRSVFDRMSQEHLGEGAMARLTQLILRSRDGALSPLQEAIGPASMPDDPQDEPPRDP
ncbi:MAG: hypothetical protein F4X84_06640 [Synechococcus sp. SB0662_bin_45]|uniref:Uncharacterized protein n=1 Tax=Synechococcus sp. SB0676_bin_10 TaxID=2604869 RepID=A0A6B1F7H2_9SYNE|nr:hypothetical protein [Synechococcus sp. SB0668_bin_13]MXX09388.1 hypothetical protein [Synechococcus sp. SB0667_bin_8]MXY18768.1 hypothetical protein [Synechococcus sp. SB0664_bin_36]MXY62640.1 hypothetical protein [Synechococcus sp. SB0665_bin_28]MYE22018.1 hypothetical protein [Synechococcus sp. SB0662_bin_45]MYF19333.1 hypothetical protein [Synechococcus sp. SB0677_bin_5]MYG38117.1 hypothetical protein [Synechococcus sp. SB0676_bin_10]MYG64996.1 hypothetical protein [Synechococcus sp. 